MSQKLVRLVWASPLPPFQKLLLVALTDIAADSGAGESSVNVLSHMTGLEPSEVRKLLQMLGRKHLVTFHGPIMGDPASTFGYQVRGVS